VKLGHLSKQTKTYLASVDHIIKNVNQCKYRANRA